MQLCEEIMYTVCFSEILIRLIVCTLQGETPPVVMKFLICISMLIHLFILQKVSEFAVVLCWRNSEWCRKLLGKTIFYTFHCFSNIQQLQILRLSCERTSERAKRYISTISLQVGASLTGEAQTIRRIRIRNPTAPTFMTLHE